MENVFSAFTGASFPWDFNVKEVSNFQTWKTGDNWSKFGNASMITISYSSHSSLLWSRIPGQTTVPFWYITRTLRLWCLQGHTVQSGRQTSHQALVFPNRTTFPPLPPSLSSQIWNYSPQTAVSKGTLHFVHLLKSW